MEFCSNPQAEGDRCIGQRNHLSLLDGYVASFLYPSSDWVFVDDSNPSGDGTFHDPYHYFLSGYNNVPSGGTIWILDPGAYVAQQLLDQPMRIEAPLGGVLLQP
jgi:hypothetical protein